MECNILECPILVAGCEFLCVFPCSMLCYRADVLNMIKSCTTYKDLQTGKRVEAMLVSIGLDRNTFLANSLMNMYSKCGEMSHAQHIFDSLLLRDRVSWNILILGHANNRHEHLALHLFLHMTHHQLLDPDPCTLVAAMKACSTLGRSTPTSLCIAKHLHTLASSYLNTNIYVATSVVDMFANCGSMTQARSIFESLNSPSLVTWNALLMGYVENGEHSVALELFSRMLTGTRPDARTYVAVLKACGSLASREDRYGKVKLLSLGIQTQRLAEKAGLSSNVFVANVLVDMFGKCGSVMDASRVFESMRKPTIVSWNSLLAAYVGNGEGELALRLFQRMHGSGNSSPDAWTFSLAIKACTMLSEKEEAQTVNGELVKMDSLQRGMFLHSLAVESGVTNNVFVGNGLITLYSACGSTIYARNIFDRMEFRDTASWTALMIGYVANGEYKTSLTLFERHLRDQCPPDSLSFAAACWACASLADQFNFDMNTLEIGMAIHRHAAESGHLTSSSVELTSGLVDMYAKVGSMQDARAVFDSSPEGVRHLAVCRNSLISGYADNGESERAIQLLASAGDSNASTYVAGLKACGNLVDERAAKGVVGEVWRSMYTAVTLTNSMVDVFGRCGNMALAVHVFDSATERDTMTWNALLGGFSRCGETEHVFEVFRRMRAEGFKPNSVTFVCVLSVCSHGGLVEEGKECFRLMEDLEMVVPDVKHLHCMDYMFQRVEDAVTTNIINRINK